MRGQVVKAPPSQAAEDEVQITELEKISPTRVDGVGTPANGFPILMMKGIAPSVPAGAVVPAEKTAPTRSAGVLSKSKHAKALELVKGVLDGTIPIPVLAKDAAGYDESADIAGALEVIRQISLLVCSEATSLGQGRLEEIWDIGTLMDALCAMKYFLISEREQNTAPLSSGAADGSLSLDGAISYKQAAKAIADAEQFTEAYRALRKTAKRLGITPDMPHDWASGENTSSKAANSSTSTTDVIKKAVAEAAAASEERIKSLEAQLAKVLATPIPGGPLLVTPLTQRPAAHPAVAKAERLRAIAAQTSDPAVATAYRALAEREERGAPITKD